MPPAPTAPPLAAIVTGACGFIGSHLSAALLRRGWTVIGVDNFDPFYDERLKRENVSRFGESFHLLQADIRDQEAMRKVFLAHRPASLFHIAALAGVRPSIADPVRYADVNVNGLVSVLEAARAADCRDVVFASSSSVYGNNLKVPFAEHDPVDEPISPYAATKRAGELICHTYTHLFAMRIAALRFFTVYGPAQRPDLAIGKFMRMIAMGQEIPMFGDGSTSRDYTFIDDIVDGVLRAHDKLRAANESFFRIYNLGNSHPTSLSQMINAIAAVVRKPARIRAMPMQPGDVERTWADVTRSKAELGFHPQASFEDGLRRQWEWLEQRLVVAANE